MNEAPRTSIPLPPSLDLLHDAGADHARTDMANARRFAQQHQNQLRYALGEKQWYLWDGRRWHRSPIEHIERLAKQTSDRLWAEIPKLSDTRDRTELAKHASRSSSTGGIRGMITLGRSEPSLMINRGALDSDGYRLNCLNGTVDLRTFLLHPHSPGNLITKLAPVEYIANAACPTWEAFLLRIMGGNTGMVTYLQRVIGYALTGDTSEQVLFFLYGLGGNGKSTFINTILEILGDYAVTIDPSSLLLQRSDLKPEIARLPGARFISTSETPSDRHLDEALVKRLTGGGKVSARRLHENPFEFVPVGKIFMEGNHRPEILGQDYAIWRRIHLIPFEHTFAEGERVLNFERRLAQERNGIFRWAVTGCRHWQAQRLSAPSEVTGATDEYRTESDPLREFLDQCCLTDPAAQYPIGWMFDWYAWWCRERKVAPLTKRAFDRSLRDRGIQSGRTANERFWKGIYIKPGLQ